MFTRLGEFVLKVCHAPVRTVLLDFLRIRAEGVSRLLFHAFGNTLNSAVSRPDRQRKARLRRLYFQAMHHFPPERYGVYGRCPQSP